MTPITLKAERRLSTDYATNVVPCGRCPACVKTRRKAWVFRLEMQQRISDSAAFLTYTYDDDNLNFTNNGLMTLSKLDHQLYMKRLRKNMMKDGFNGKLKYYAVGEYGTTTHRPHCHAIVYNLPGDYINQDKISEIWQKGHVQVDSCNSARIAYVAGYCMKKMDPVSQRDPLDDRLPEWSMMSKRLGENYLTDSIMSYYRRKMEPYIRDQDGKKLPMPRYYKDKIFSELDKKILAKKSKEYLDSKYDDRTEKEKVEWIESQFRKRDRILREKRSQL